MPDPSEIANPKSEMPLALLHLVSEQTMPDPLPSRTQTAQLQTDLAARPHRRAAGAGTRFGLRWQAEPDTALAGAGTAVPSPIARLRGKPKRRRRRPTIAGKAIVGATQNAHPGGWLPNWVFVRWNFEQREIEPVDRNGRVLLASGPGADKAKRKGLSAGRPIVARLVAAIVPKPLVVTGLALPNEVDPGRCTVSAAKSTHLAVPAGAVCYFETDSEAEAVALANALNWHGNTAGAIIKNRRSTLPGEKGFGLGVCGTWNFFA